MITALIRTIFLYFFIMIGLRLMGKRQIGELEPSELVLTMLISDLAAVPMQDFGIPLIYGIIPIATLLSLSMLMSFFNLKSIRFRELTCGKPAVIIQNGKLCQQAMRRNRFTLDELMEQLRTQGVNDPKTVKYALLETSGQLSILLYTENQPVTPSQLQLDIPDDVFLPTVLINDGRLIKKSLCRCGLDQNWLCRILQENQLSSISEVFFLSIDAGQNITLIPKEP